METEDIRFLLRKAEEGRKESYAPYSHFPVGAALLGKSGKVYVGCNVENVSFGATLCAERNAIGSAVAAGEREFSAIAIIGSRESYTMPCGICLQVMGEFRIPTVICGKNEEDYRVYALSDLLPYGFEEKSLKK